MSRRRDLAFYLLGFCWDPRRWRQWLESSTIHPKWRMLLPIWLPGCWSRVNSCLRMRICCLRWHRQLRLSDGMFTWEVEYAAEDDDATSHNTHIVVLDQPTNSFHNIWICNITFNCNYKPTQTLNTNKKSAIPLAYVISIMVVIDAISY